MDGHKYVQYFSAFKREDRLIISSCVKTQEDLWYLHRPIVVLDSRITFSEIGQAVFQALSESQIGFLEPPGPAELDETMDHLFRAVGVWTFDQFQEGVLHCGVGRGTNGIEITPTYIGGTHEIHFLLDRRILLETDVSPEQLGAAFLEGFAVCTSIYE